MVQFLLIIFCNITGSYFSKEVRIWVHLLVLTATVYELKVEYVVEIIFVIFCLVFVHCR